MIALFIAALLCVALCFVPGSIVLYGLGFRTSFSISAAPVLSVLIICVFGIVFHFAKISLSPIAFILIVLVFSLLLFAIEHAVWRSKRREGASRLFPPVRFLPLYILVGLLVTYFVYIGNLSDPSCFVQRFDNASHLSTVAAFLESGFYDCFSTNCYVGGYSPAPGSGYYPAFWHILVALVSPVCAGLVTVAANAVNYAIAGVLFPVSMCLLANTVFKDDDCAVAFGSLTVLLFGAFPWGFLNWGPLYSNFISMSLVPLSMALFIACFTETNRLHKKCACLLFVLAGFDFIFLQPNSVFVEGVLLCPFLGWILMRFLRKKKLRRIIPVALVLYCVAVGAVWVALFYSPPLHSVVNFHWAISMGKKDAFISCISLAFLHSSYSQWSLSALVCLGIIYTLRHREYLWLALSWVMACALYCVSVSCSGFLKQLLCGFWYTDPYRIAAIVVLSAIPLATLGLRFLYGAIRRVIAYINCPNLRKCSFAINHASYIAIGIIVALWPALAPESLVGLNEVGAEIASWNSFDSDQPLSQEKISFLDEVSNAVPPGTLIINEPHDGSVYAYSYKGLNVLYRIYGIPGRASETEESILLRKSLCDVSTNIEVANALSQVGAQYLLKLNYQDDRSDAFYPDAPYHPDEWIGINAVRDDTPGFKIILSNGNCRLYLIESPQGVS